MFYYNSRKRINITNSRRKSTFDQELWELKIYIIMNYSQYIQQIFKGNLEIIIQLVTLKVVRERSPEVKVCEKKDNKLYK